MGKRKPDSLEGWQAELAWVLSVKDNPPGAFVSYCEMQARFAEKDGFPEIANQILDASRQSPAKAATKAARIDWTLQQALRASRRQDEIEGL